MRIPQRWTQGSLTAQRPALGARLHWLGRILLLGLTAPVAPVAGQTAVLPAASVKAEAPTVEIARPPHSAPYRMQRIDERLQPTYPQLGNRTSSYGSSLDAPLALSAFATLGEDPDRWRGARRGAKIGAVVGALAGVVGFAVILHSTEQAVEKNRAPCSPEDACHIQAGPNVGRLFLPVAYLIFAGVGAAGGALVGAGVGAAVGR